MNLHTTILTAFLGMVLQFAVASPIDNVALEIPAQSVAKQFRSCPSNYLYLDTCADTITDDKDWWNVNCFVRCLQFTRICRNLEPEWKNAVSAIDVQSDTWACRLYENAGCQGDFFAFQGKIHVLNGDWNDRASSYECGPRNEIFAGTTQVEAPPHASIISINAETGVMAHGHESKGTEVHAPHITVDNPPPPLVKRQHGIASFGQGCPKDQLNLKMCGYDWNPASNNWSDPKHCGLWRHEYKIICINLALTPWWNQHITAVSLEARDNWACRIFENNDCRGSWFAFTGAVPSLDDPYFWKNQAGSVECGPIPYIYNWVNQTRRSVPEAEFKKPELPPCPTTTEIGQLKLREPQHLLKKRCALPDTRCPDDQGTVIMCNKHEQGPDGCDKCFGMCAQANYKCYNVPADFKNKASYYWVDRYIDLYEDANCKGDKTVTPCCQTENENDLDFIGWGGEVSSFRIVAASIWEGCRHCSDNSAPSLPQRAVSPDMIIREPHCVRSEAKALVPLEKRCARPDICCDDSHAEVILCDRNEKGNDGCDKCIGMCVAMNPGCINVPGDFNGKMSY